MGPAGQLLDDMISSAMNQCDEENQDNPVEFSSKLRLAFTNVVCCIPIDENGKKALEPEIEHAKACAPRLIEFVDKVAQPKLVILVGKYAAKYVKKFFHPHRDWESVEITHPAALLRTDIGQRGLLIQRAIVTIRDAFETVLEKI